MIKQMRSRKMQRIDRVRGHECMEAEVEEKAREDFKRPAFCVKKK